MQRGDYDHVPLETFGLVNGHQLDRCFLSVGFRIQVLQATVDQRKRDRLGSGLERVEQIKEAPGVGSLMFLEGSIAPKAAPCAFDMRTERRAAKRVDGLFQDGPATRQQQLTMGAEPAGSGSNQVWNRCMEVCFGAVPGDGKEVIDPEPTHG